MGVKLGPWHWGRNVGWGCLRIGCWGEYLDLRRTRWQGSGLNFIIRRLMIYTPHQILFGWLNQEEWDGRGMYNAWGRGKVYTEFWWGNLRERDHLEDPGIDGRIISRWIFRKRDVGVWSESSWLRIGAGGGQLWRLEWIFGFHKMQRISWLAENRLAA